MVQGTEDVLVSRPLTDQLTEDLCANGSDVTYQVYEGADHRAVLEDSFDDVRAFAEGALAGEAPETTCS